MKSDTHEMNPYRSIEAALRWAKSQGLEPLEAELLMLHATKHPKERGRTWLRTHLSDELSVSELSQYRDLCIRRIDQQPLAYLTGTREFYGLKLHIDHRVLDPRADTETLVDWALDAMRDIPQPVVADLGTGSGAIALAIKYNHPTAQVFAIDKCVDALAVAKSNALQLRLTISFLQGSWLEPLTPYRCHLIVSNPPYIAENDPHLPALRHEPLKALTSGKDGLEDIRALIFQAPDFLIEGGQLLLEHGFDQSDTVQQLMQQRGFIEVVSRTDIHGHVRCTGGTWLG